MKTNLSDIFYLFMKQLHHDELEIILEERGIFYEKEKED